MMVHAGSNQVFIGTIWILFETRIIAHDIAILLSSLLEYLLRHVIESEAMRWQMQNRITAMSDPVFIGIWQIFLEPFTEFYITHSR